MWDFIASNAFEIFKSKPYAACGLFFLKLTSSNFEKAYKTLKGSPNAPKVSKLCLQNHFLQFYILMMFIPRAGFDLGICLKETTRQLCPYANARTLYLV